MESLSFFTPAYWSIFLAIASMALVGMAASTNQAREPDEEDTSGVGHTRRKRRSRRSKQDRGLPSDKLLKDMARAYLSKQNLLWPKLALVDVFPGDSAQAIAELAEQFTLRFRKGVKQPIDTSAIGDHCEAIAGAYVRFSCDKSNPRSLVQQLSLILDRAKANNHFIPWELVFADAAISATTANHRQGYVLTKNEIADTDSPLSILYFDELGRASRDTIESLKLGRLVASRGKRLVGVSDAFDSAPEMSKLNLPMFAMVHEHFIDQLKSKVNRGMQDAFHRGTNLRPPAFGYCLVPAVDGNGNPIRGRDGSQCNMLAIEPSEASFVRLAFRLYGERGKSRNAIARFFNRRQVGNQTWDASRLKQIYERFKYIGIEVENMTYREVDIDDEGNEVRVTKTRPRSEWQVRRARHLQIVPRPLWNKVQDRLAESHEAYRRKKSATRNRSDVNPTTLVRPICGSCGKPMWLGRSGKYASFTCLNGREGKYGCKHRGYKSVKIVEAAILEYVNETILTAARIETLVETANAYLREQAAKPLTDTSAWKSELKALAKKRDKLADVIEGEDDHDLKVLLNRLRSYQAEMRKLQTAIREADGQRKLPAEITKVAAVAHLSSLRDLLQRDVPNAARILRAITGAIVVRLEKEDGRRSATWYADFSVNLTPVMLELSQEAGCPSARTWEYLNTRSWTTDHECQVRLEHTTQYERLGPAFAELFQKGAKVQEIADAHGMPWKQAKEILDYGLTGKQPRWAGHARSKNRSTEPQLYKIIHKDVVQLRDQEEQTWPKIVEWLYREKQIKVSLATVRRAYDFIHQDKIRKSVEAGEIPFRGRWRHLAPEKVKLIRELLKARKLNISEIAEKAGVSVQTVRRERDAIGDK